MEDQYYVGSPKLGAAIRDAMDAAVNPNLIGIVVIAAEDSVADLPDLPFRRRDFLAPLAAAFPNRFLIFERLGGGSTTGPTAYVHSKLLVVDDEAAFIGSVNSSRRSWSHDTEVDATIVDSRGPRDTALGNRGWVRDFRCNLWDKHFAGATACTGDPVSDLAVWLGIATGAITGASVRLYNVTATPPRPHFPDRALNWYWNTVADPA